MIRNLCLVFSAVFSVSASDGDGLAIGAAETTWEVTPGPFANDPRLPALLERATEARGKALARLREEWKLSPGTTPIRWRFETAAAPAGPAPRGVSASRSRELPDFELGRTYFARGAVNVLLPARKFLARPGSVEAVVVHECVHAVHASLARSRERYEATPRWLREGLALLFSGEGDERVRDRVAYAVYRGEGALSFLKGMDAPGATRAEAYLAVVWLRARLGPDRFALFAGRVLRPGSTGPSLADLDLPAFREGALVAAKRAVRALLPRPREERFRSLLARLRSDATATLPELEVLLAEDERGPLAGTLRYLLGREASRSPDARALGTARSHLEALQRATGTLWRPETLVLLGQCYLKEGRGEAARRSWVEVLESYGEDRAVAEPARRLLAALED